MAPARQADDLREALGRASERVLAHEDRLASACASVLRKAGQIAAKRFRELARPHLTAAGDAGWTPPHPDELVDVDAIVAGLRGKSDPIRRAAIANYGRELARLFPDVDWSVTNPLVGNVLSGAAQHVGDIADTTRINLMRILSASYDQGLSIEDTAKAIRQGMEAASTVRGRLIARTELAAVTNGGSLAATQLVAGATDTPYFKRWMTAPGAHYPRHEDYEGLDGQTVPLEQAFDVGGVALQFPGDPDGPPEEICNCRCSLAYVTSPDEQIGGESLYAPESGDVLSEPLSTEANMPASAVGAQEGEDAAALSIVLGDDGIATQAALRTGDIPDWMPGDLKVVDAIIGRNRLPEPAVSLRGVQNVADTPFGGVPKVGDEAYDPAYGSTSVDPKVAAGFAGDGKDAAFVTYHLPQGAPALYVPRITPLEDATGQQEKELLLPRGQTLRVVGVDEFQGKPNIHVELADYPLSHPADAAGYRADVGITPFRSGTEIGPENTLAAVLKEHPGAGIVYQEEVRRLGADAERSVTILLTRVPATPEATAALRDVLRYADMRGKEVRLTPDVGAQLSRAGVLAPVPEAEGSSIDEIVTKMGAHELDVNPDFRPDLFKEPIKLKGGGFATPRNDLPAPRVKTRADKSTYGLPPRIEDTVENKFGNAQVVEGSERPPEYLYRAISEEDYQQALARGYLQSDQRMNLAEEGTVADFTDPSFYLPGKLASDIDGVYPGRIVRIRYRDEDGWKLDHDGYAKTPDPIPISQIDLVSPKIETVRGTADNGGPTFETRIVPAEITGFRPLEDQGLDILGRPPNAELRGKGFLVGGDDPIGFYNSDKYVGFLNDMRAAADHYAVAIDGLDRAEGLWQGETEPSLALHVHDGEVGVRGFAADLGKAYEQDGVLLFAPDAGYGAADMLATFAAFPDRERVLAAMKAAGLPGGRFLSDGRLQVVGTGSEFAGKVKGLAKNLGVTYEVEFGRFEMLERDSGAYERAIQEASQRSAGTLPLDPSSSLPADRTLSLSTEDLLDSNSANAVFRVQHEGQDFIVKPEPGEDSHRMRRTITPGNDGGRERAAYVLSRYWNDLDPAFSVRLPVTRVSDVFVPEGVESAVGEVASGWQRATISEFVEGEDARDLFDPGWQDVIDPVDVRNGGLFDAVIGNTDRHAGNFKIDPTNGRTTLIDHGLAFPEANDYFYNANLIREAEEGRTATLEPDELAFLERFRALRPQLDKELEVDLDAESLAALWERVDYMIEHGTRLPPGIDG